MTTDAQVKWRIDGDYFQACSCDWGCPCEFEAPPTQGFCEDVSVWRINQGNYGDVSLDGLCFGVAARWPQARTWDMELRYPTSTKGLTRLRETR